MPDINLKYMKILCVFGKYQYGNPLFGIGTEYAAFIPALKNLGHKVKHFDSWNRSLFDNYAKLNSAFLKTVENTLPDIILVVQMNYEIWTDTLQIIKDRKDIATICWTTDDTWKYREVSRYIGRAYHVMTTTYPEFVGKYRKDGINNILLTQWAANSKTLKEPLPAAKCRYKVSFVGAAHGIRKKVIGKMKRSGINVFCFGEGWPAGPVDADQIPTIMRDSLISLGFTNSKGINQIKARTFEVPGAGGFLLTQYAKGLERYYEIGNEIETFSSIKELKEKICFYLSNYEKRDLIARQGFQKTLCEHTYEKRLNEVIDFAIKSMENLPKRKNIISDTSFEQISKTHKLDSHLKIIRKLLVFVCKLIWKNSKGSRAARRIIYELSWRFFGKKTYSASGWPGRMFPEQ